MIYLMVAFLVLLAFVGPILLMGLSITAVVDMWRVKD